MKSIPLIFLACSLGLASQARSELPQFSVTKIKDFFPALGPVGDPTFPNSTFVFDVSAGNSNFLALFVDRKDPNNAVDELEINYVVDAATLTPILMAAPPVGFGTGTSGAIRSSSAGHVVFSVSVEGDRGTPGWLDRIQVARTAPDGTTTVLPAVGIEQRGVNASGMVIGDGPEDFTAWRYTDVGGWQNLGSLGPSGYAQAKGINNAGLVVGRSANSSDNIVPFIYREGVGMQAITNGGTPVGGQAVAINDAGLVTGTANGRAFIYNAETMEFNFVTTAATGWMGVDINNAAAVIGATRTGGSILGIPTDSAFYWDAENGANSFDNLIGVAVDDWFITDVTDLNDNGWVLGTGFQRSDGSYHRILLRPIPEMGTVVLLLAASGVWVGRRRRRLGV